MQDDRSQVTTSLFAAWPAAILLLACAFFVSPATAGLDDPAHTGQVVEAGVAFSPPPNPPPSHPAVTIERPAGVDLVITLDQQIHDMLADALQAYARKKGLRLALHRGTCGQSLAELERHQADIGGFCCPPGPGDRLPGLRFHTLGIGAIAIITHPDSPLTDLSRRQVADLFAGRLRHLPVTGGEPILAMPVVRLHCASRPGHWRLILPGEEDFFPLARPTGGIDAMLQGVRQYIGAVGYETLYWIDREAPELKILKIDGISPRDQAALLRGDYPYYRVFNVTSWADSDRDEAVAALIDWLKKAFAQASARSGTLPAERLRAAGWRFAGDELIGTPR